jgi:hypothetical protein
MSAAQKKPPDFLTLPDFAVVSDDQAAKLLNFSKDTLRRPDKAGQGPPRVQLSPGRFGRTVGGIRDWPKKRTVATATGRGVLMRHALDRYSKSERPSDNRSLAKCFSSTSRRVPIGAFHWKQNEHTDIGCPTQ